VNRCPKGPNEPPATTPTAPTLVDPDPGDVATDTGVALAKTQPTNLVPIELEPNDITVDPVRIESISFVPVDPVPVDPVRITSITPTDRILVDFVPVDPIPVNPSPAIVKDCTPAAPIPVNPDPGDAAADSIGLEFASVPAHPILVDSIPVTSINAVPVLVNHNFIVRGETICITPTEPVHVDPVRAFVPASRTWTPVLLGSILFHFHLLGECVKGRVLDRERGRSLFVGGALVIVSFAHSTCGRDTATGASD
jgi:hypothetical protein